MNMINRVKQLNHKEKSKLKIKNIGRSPMGITYLQNPLWKKERYISPFYFEYKKLSYSDYSIWW